MNRYKFIPALLPLLFLFIPASLFAATAPGTPDLLASNDSGSSNSDNITNNNHPVFTGTCTGEEVITLVIDSVEDSGSTYTCASGSYSVSPSSPFADGTYTIGARADDGTDADSATTLSLTIDTTAPTPTVTDFPAATQTALFTITIATGEDTSDLLLGDLSATNASVSNFVGASLQSYTVGVTPTADGSVSFRLPQSVYTDTAGNWNDSSPVYSVEADITAPQPVITSAASGTVNAAFTINIDTGENTTDFIDGDITVTNASISTISGSDSSYSATVTPSGTGSVTVDIAASAYTDAAGNNSLAASQFSIEADMTKPTPTITSTASGTQSRDFEVYIDTGEVTTDFIATDIMATNATVSALSGSGSNYVATITPTADGTITLSIVAGVYMDAAGNTSNALATNYTIASDVTAPIPAISSGASAPVTTTFSVTIDVGETPSDFTITDISANNATISNLVLSSGTQYSLDVTPTATGTISIDIDAGGYTDAAGNANAAASQFTITSDISAPQPVITSAASGTVNAAFTVSIDTKETPTGFAVDDIAVTNGTKGTWGVPVSGTVYTLEVTPSGTGSVTVDIGASAYTDAAGNNSLAASQFSIEADMSAPTPIIYSSASGTQNGTFSVSIDTGESTSNFVIGDITEANASLTNFSGSGQTYSVDVTPSGDGAVTLSIAAGAYTDPAGNSNLVSSQFSIEADMSAPTPKIYTNVSGTQTGAFTVYIDTEESTTGFSVDDIAVTNGTKGTLGVPISGTVYTLEITPSGTGSVTVDIAASAYTDAAGNNSLAASQFSIEADTQAPTLTTVTIADSDGDGTAEIGDTVTLSITANEPLSGAPTVTIAGQSASVTTVTAETVYTASYTVTSTSTEGVVAFSIAFQDAAGNSGTSVTSTTNSSSVSINHTPTYTISSGSGTADTYDFTVTFSEAVYNVDSTDFTLSTSATSSYASAGTVTSPITSDNTTYTVRVVDMRNTGTITLGVAAGNNIQDTTNTALASATNTGVYTYTDSTVPTVLSITAVPSSGTAGSVTYSVLFSEPVQSVGLGDFTLSHSDANGVAGTVDSVTASNSNQTWDLAVSGIAVSGNITLSFAANSIQDYSNNMLGTPGDTGLYAFNDIVRPTITSITPASSSGTSTSMTFTITFSEEVLNVSTEDFQLVTSSTGTDAYGGDMSMSGSGATWTLTLSNIAGNGTVTLSVLDSNNINDESGNALGSASNSATYTYTDVIAPTVASIVPSSGSGTAASIDFTITFSESVINVGLEDFVLTTTGANSGALSDFQQTNARTYSLTASGYAGSGTLSLAIDANVQNIEDEFGNALTVNSVTGDYVYTDTTAPTLDSLVANQSAGTAQSATFTATFSEDVVNIDTSDFFLSGTSSNLGSITAVAGGNKVWTITASGFEGTGVITLGVQVTSNGQNITDGDNNALGNSSLTASYSFTDQAAIDAHLATTAVGASVVGKVMNNIARKTISSRTGRRLEGASGGTVQCRDLGSCFNVGGWTEISSDDFRDALVLHNKRLYQSKLEGLGYHKEAQGLEAIERNTGGYRARGLDAYTSVSFGYLNREGDAGYDGDGLSLMIGADYVLGERFLFGAMSAFERAKIDFTDDANGKFERDGLRLEFYQGVRLLENVYVDNSFTFAHYNNEIYADNRSGKTDSRLLGITTTLRGNMNFGGAALQPYLQGSYSYETFDAYTTSMNDSVPEQSLETTLGSLGLDIQAQKALFGPLRPYAGVQYTWDISDADDITLANGDVFENDVFSGSFNMGMELIIDNGHFFDNFTAHIEYHDTGLFTDNRSYQAQMGIGIRF